MLGANVDVILTSPPTSPIIVGIDGLWGAHEWTVYPQLHSSEFPYLAWIPLCLSNAAIPSSALTKSVDKLMWQTHSDHSNLHIIDSTLLDKLTWEWATIKDSLQDPFHIISSDPSFLPVQCPAEAYVRAFVALSWLRKEFGTWQDFVEVFRGLQRSLLELQAFLDWWKDIHTSDNFQSPIRAPTQGVIFEDVQLYKNYAHWSVGAYLLIHQSVFVLDCTKEVRLSPCKLCQAQPISLQPHLHSLDLWYYPLLIQDVMMDLEAAARVMQNVWTLSI
jgi:hypothetical protein